MELRRVDRDLPALTVLALLLTGPRHTYEMHRMMIDTRKEFVTGLPRSRYHAVDRLLRDELIRVHEVLRDGPRPERNVYALTDAGRTELHERGRTAAGDPRRHTRRPGARASMRTWLDGLPGEISDGRPAWPDDIEALVDFVSHGAVAERAGPVVEETRMG